MTMAKKNTPRDESGRYAYEGLDRVLHEKARLGIMTSLVTRSEGVLFNETRCPPDTPPPSVRCRTARSSRRG